MGCAAADGLEAYGSGSGEEVDKAGFGDAGTEDIEERFAEPVAGGAGAGAGGRCQKAGTVFAGDDAHLLMVAGARWNPTLFDVAERDGAPGIMAWRIQSRTWLGGRFR